MRYLLFVCFQNPNIPAKDQTDYILPPPKDAPQNPYQAKRNASSDENAETFDGVLRTRAGSHPVSAPATPSNQRKNVVELMPPPLVPKTPRQRQGQHHTFNNFFFGFLAFGGSMAQWSELGI